MVAQHAVGDAPRNHGDDRRTVSGALTQGPGGQGHGRREEDIKLVGGAGDDVRKGDQHDQRHGRPQHDEARTGGGLPEQRLA